MAIDTGKTFISINSVDLSAQCTSAPGVEQAREEVDITTFGAAIRRMQQTLEQAPELVFAFLQNFAGGSVHATLQPLYDTPSEFPVKIRPSSAAIGVANPEFRFNATVTRYTPLDGSQVANVHRASLAIRRTTVITIATS